MTSDQSPRYADAISGIESGGNYGALGPPTKGDRAYGKYQIMGSNIPEWTQAALGQPLTPEQFLANPQAQDAVFQFKFGQYVNKYGPEGAAKAWFAGEKGMNNPNAKDALGTSVADYGAKFMRGLGQPATPQIAPQTPIPAIAPQMPAGAVSLNSMPAYGSMPNNAPAGTAESQMTPQFQPIQYAPRRPPDLTQLQALLQRSPATVPGFSFART